MVQTAERVANLAPYLFAALERKMAEVQARGIDVISLGIGDPDLPTPAWVVEKMQAEVANPAWHHYPLNDGSLEFRRALCDFYSRRFGVTGLAPETEALTLIGSKEGLAHIIWAFIDRGDIALVPDPGYPIYKTHVGLAGGTVYPIPLTPANGFLPDLDAIPLEVAAKAKLMFINYPNNPTGAVCDLAFYAKTVAYCKAHDILLVSDNAYSEMTYDGYQAPSVLQVPGAKDVAVEFWSLSKPFNMTGWRVGGVVGNAAGIAGLRTIKTNIDSGPFTAIQMAAITALTDPRGPAFIQEMNAIYRRRRDVAVAGLRAIGLAATPCQGSFYLWVPVPAGCTSTSFAAQLLEEAGVAVTPGLGYGEQGEGFVRLALTIDEARLTEAIGRMKAHVKMGSTARNG